MRSDREKNAVRPRRYAYAGPDSLLPNVVPDATEDSATPRT
jgi:hypothetical protein